MSIWDNIVSEYKRQSHFAYSTLRGTSLQDLRFERDARRALAHKQQGSASGSKRFAIVAPRAEDEQKYLTKPLALGAPHLQNAAGKAYFMAGYDAVGDTCHPVRG